MGADDTQEHGIVELAEFREPCLGKAHLIVVRGDHLGQRHLVRAGCTIGRSSSNDLMLVDPRVSRHQARLEKNDRGQLLLVDVAGKGSTRVNGKALSQHALCFGDQIELGMHTLVVAPLQEEEREELSQDRLKAIGYLSAGIAHDFNNMLGVVLSTLNYLEELPPMSTSDGEIKECFEDIRGAAERSSALVERMLVFARRETDQQEVCDLSGICNEVVKLASRGFGASIRIEPSIERDLWVAGARTQLVQLVLNLCINARDAMPKGGVLRIAASRGRNNPEVKVSIADTGVGMDDETRRQIFDKFFTTKEGTGTGLGLALVSEIVRWHGGRIEVESEPNKGSRFDVYLPYRSPDLATRALPGTVATPSSLADKRKAVILVVDDDRMVLRSTMRLLRVAGHQVLGAQDGMEAVQVLRDADPRPDLILLDLDMPGLDGEETWKQLAMVDATVPVAFLSGHTVPDTAQRLVDQGALGFLQKPYTASQLRRLIGRAFEE